jgi:hypothetical protein
VIRSQSNGNGYVEVLFGDSIPNVTTGTYWGSMQGSLLLLSAQQIFPVEKFAAQ